MPASPPPSDVDSAADRADLDIAEAAGQLGISEEAVELAIERGFLRGHFDEARGRWRVRLDYTSSMADPAVASPARPTVAVAAAVPKSKAARSGDQARARAHGQVQASTAPTQAQASTQIQTPAPAAPPAPNRGAASDGVETVLREQVHYLRQQLERREAALRTKDAAIAELMQQLAKFAKRALPATAAESEGLRVDFDRYRTVQREALSRHERAIASISETLSLVRDHLILLRPNADSMRED